MSTKVPLQLVLAPCDTLNMEDVDMSNEAGDGPMRVICKRCKWEQEFDKHCGGCGRQQLHPNDGKVPVLHQLLMWAVFFGAFSCVIVGLDNAVAQFLTLCAGACIFGFV